MIPPTIGVSNVNPKLQLEDWNFQIVREATQWPSKDAEAPRRVSINSFGYGGANAHIILERGNTDTPKRAPFHADRRKSSFLLPLSAKSPSSLRRRVSDLAAANSPSLDLHRLSSTLVNHRSSFPSRGYLVVKQDSMVEDIHPDKLRSTEETAGPASILPIAFVYTGQGAQWPGMGLQLMKEYPSFRKSIRRLDAILKSLPKSPNWTIEGI